MKIIPWILAIAAALGFFAAGWYSNYFIDAAAPDTNETPVEIESVQSVSSVTIPSDSLFLSAKTGLFKGYLTRKEFPPSMSAAPETCDVFVITEGDLSMFYEFLAEDTWQPVAQSRLPYELVIDTKQLPLMTQEALNSSSAQNPIVVAVTNYVSTAGKDQPTCASSINGFIAL